MSRDNIFEHEKLGDEPFRFDESVTRVFPDMLQRSIPGYAASIEAIGSLASRYITADSNAYDLGCSLGAATLAMRQGARAQGVRFVAIDNSPDMIARCHEILAGETGVDLVEGDIRDAEIQNASMVVLNYTLQFLSLEDRDAVIARVHAGMNDGGLLVLSEKVVDEDPHMERLLTDLHHEHKRRNDYSALEIARKRAALENVLVPETVAKHRERLQKAGFRHTGVWLRYFNFVSIIAIR